MRIVSALQKSLSAAGVSTGDLRRAVPHAATQVAAGPASAWAGRCLPATILLAAFLLFQIQPLLAKFILPWFGGCPAVWTTSMLFFQALLLAGYVYAHLVQRWLTPRRQAILHLALAVAAVALLPVIPCPSWKPTDSSAPTWRILSLLTATIGLPYFVLSGTSPLLQAWYSRCCPGRSPYRLYALSNAGSLAALLSYPFFFEPALNLVRQSLLWSAMFIVYAVFCGFCLVFLWRTPRWRPRENHAAELTAAAVGIRQRLLWLALPACASLMLLATTNHVCQDVAVVPMLWVVPLSLYLLTFIIAFDHPRWYARGLWAAAAAAALAAVVDYEHFHWLIPPMGLVGELTLYFTAMFLVCMVCHGALFRLRPDPRRLTEFYLMISAGGVAGGVLVGLVAPLIFSTYFEWEIGLALCLAVAAAVLGLTWTARRLRSARGLTLAAAAATAPALLLLFWSDTIPAMEKSRSFYGTVTIGERLLEGTGEPWIIMKHGWITHGRQFLDPDKRRWPTYTYGPHSGIGQALRQLELGGPIRVGVVGLGVGTIAAYARAGDQFRFYEINPEVLRLALKHFTYLDDCRGKWDVWLGDGRLSLEREKDRFDLLVLDAFSGDAVPTHLLTAEAFEIYLRRLAPRGVIAVHVTNRYLHLAPVVRRLAQNAGLRYVRVCDPGESRRLEYHSDWMLLSSNEEFLRAIELSRAVEAAPPKDAGDDFPVPLWTDHYSNLFQILKPAG